MEHRELVERIDSVEAIRFATVAFRHVAVDRDPLSGAGARLNGGRWNPPESFAAIYLALERRVAVAEFERMAVKQGRQPRDFLPRRLHRVEASLNAVLDLRDPGVRRTLDISGSALVDDDVSRCRAIGAAAQDLGLQGLLAPSAAIDGSVLAVFPDRLDAESQLTVVDFEDLADRPT